MHNAEEIKDRLGYLPEEKGLYKKMKTERDHRLLRHDSKA